MKWIKKGLVLEPNTSKWWSQAYCMMPTPEYLETENLIRVYFGTTDKEKNGRTAYVDLSADNPSDIIHASEDFILDVGGIGFFDDSGAIPSCIITVNNNKFLYYVGFQRAEKVPYMLYSGLAKMEIGNDTFIRQSNSPIIDRNEFNTISNAAPYVIYDEGIYKMWYWLGKEWTTIKGKLYIKAVICYAESINGINWISDYNECIKLDPEKEFSVGRPCVLKEDGLYKMWYSVRYIDKLYRIGYAESTDGKKWVRKDSEAGIDVSENGWDSEMICYPAVIKVKGKTYMFYNGNSNGVTGFGYAVLAEE